MLNSVAVNDMEDYEIIDWPDCEYFMELEGWEANSTLIEPHGAMGIDSSTYLVSKEWLKSLEEKKEQLVILEYATQAVHVYNVDPSVNIGEEYISNLGFHTSECEWMFGESIEIIRHKGLLR